MGKLAFLSDGLKNAITGAGTSRDPRTSSHYSFMPLDQASIEAAYRGSGLMRKIINIPALDMVREWREWSGMDAADIEKIENTERVFQIRQKIKQAEVLRGLGGGALIMGLPGDPSMPAPAGSKLSFVHVVSRWQISYQEIEQDARKPGYGEPVMWTLTAKGGGAQVHPSRVIPFRADTAAMAASLQTGAHDEFWGDSTVAQVLDAVKDSDTARAAFASLMQKARTVRLGIPGLSQKLSAPNGQAGVQERLSTLALAESTLNAFVYDSGDGEGKGGEEIKDSAYTFAGAKDILNAYAEFVAAISDIPATRLLGRAPEGMNSSGESQQRDWSKKVRAMQTLELAPCLDRLDSHLLPTAINTRPDSASYDFSPLDLPSEKEKAERFKTYMEGADKLRDMSAMPEEAFNRGLQSRVVEDGFLPGLAAALAEYSEEERFGLSLEADPEPVSFGDAAPRTLYVSRPVLNRDELQAWATEQGLGELQPDLHVTIAHSSAPVDWMKVEDDWGDPDGTLTIKAGGPRLVEPLGDHTAVLLFSSSHLGYRHERIRSIGASWDYADYQPHISLTGEPVQLDNVEPYKGVIELGPEVFEEVI